MHDAILDNLLVLRRPPRPIATVNLGCLGVLCAIRAMDGRKPLVPSSCLAMQVGTERCIFHASQACQRT